MATAASVPGSAVAGARSKGANSPGAATRQLPHQDPGQSALSCCSAAGLCTAATCCVLDHISRSRISAVPESLNLFLEAYGRLAGSYGRTVVLEWLRRSPSIIRCEPQCPAVLGVEQQLVLPRLHQLCNLLQRPFETEAASILSAAPALVAMQPQTLAEKVTRLQALAATHPRWQAAIASSSAKSLAVMLTYSLQRQQRLQYIVDQGLQDSIPGLVLVTLRQLTAATMCLAGRKAIQRYDLRDGAPGVYERVMATFPSADSMQPQGPGPSITRIKGRMRLANTGGRIHPPQLCYTLGFKK
eukprot:gene14300-27_t